MIYPSSFIAWLFIAVIAFIVFELIFNRYHLASIFYFLYQKVSPNPSKRTGNHPDYKKSIKHAFDLEGQSFYCFTSSGDMPTARFEAYSEFLEDYQRRVDNDELQEAMKYIIEGLEENSVKGVTQAFNVAQYVQQRTKIAMDTDLFWRFLSCAYFTLDEDLISYDYSVAEKKIELWKKHGLKSFFLSEPSKKWLPFKNPSDIDLDTLEKNTAILRAYWERLKAGKGNYKKGTAAINTKNSSGSAET